MSFYGHDAAVRLDLLPDGPRVVARVDRAREPPEVGAVVEVRVAGRATVFASLLETPTDSRARR